MTGNFKSTRPTQVMSSRYPYDCELKFLSSESPYENHLIDMTNLSSSSSSTIAFRAAKDPNFWEDITGKKSDVYLTLYSENATSRPIASLTGPVLNKHVEIWVNSLVKTQIESSVTGYL